MNPLSVHTEKYSLKLSLKEVLSLLGIFLGAVLMRMLFSYFTPTIPTDGVYYALMGKRLVEEGLMSSFSVYWSPGLPTIVGLFYLFIDNLEVAARLAAITSGALVVIPVYLLARNFYSRAVGYLGALLAATHPFLAFFSAHVYAEAPYTFFLAGTILVFWFALTTGKTRYFILTGAGCAALFLTRSEAIGYLPVFMLLPVLKWLTTRKGGGRLVVNLIVFTVFFSVLIAPYMLFLKSQMGHWSIGTRGKANLHALDEQKSSREQWYGLDPVTGESKAELLYVKGKVKGKDLGKMTRVKMKAPMLIRNTLARLNKQLVEMLPELVTLAMILLIAVGFFDKAWSRKRLKQEMYLLMFMSLTMLGYAIVHVIPRYLTVLLPLFCIWTGKGIVEFAGWVKGVRPKLGFPRPLNEGAVIAFTFIVVIASFFPKYVRSSGGDFYQKEVVYKTMGSWIKDNLGENLTVMSLKPMTAFYAHGRHVYIPWADYKATLEYARKKGVDVVAIDEKAFREKRPTLPALLDEDLTGQGLSVVYSSQDGEKIIIYTLDNDAH